METLGTQHQNLDHKVYKAVKAMLIERKLQPGSKIIQDKLAHELGVSRTPLVNALKKLEHEKLISAIPRRGFFVRLFSRQEMMQIFELREVLEGLVARRAAIRITDEELLTLQQFFVKFRHETLHENIKQYAREDRNFHRFLIDVGGKGFLSDILETYNILTLSYQIIDQEGLVRPPKETLAEHLAIIDAVSHHAPVQAERLIRLHLQNSRTHLLEKMSND